MTTQGPDRTPHAVRRVAAAGSPPALRARPREGSTHAADFSAKLAERFDGTFEHDGEGWIKEPHYVMTCVIDGIALTLDYAVTSTGKNTSYWTRVRIPCDPDLEFSVYKESVFQKLSKQLGFQDVEVGDTDYDRTFMIKAANADVFLKRCSRAFRKEHLRASQVQVGADAGRLGLVHDGLVSEYDAALALVEFAIITGKAFAEPPPPGD